MFGALRTPHPLGISNPFRGGSMDIFWNYTLCVYMYQGQLMHYAVVISQSKVLPRVNRVLVYVMCPFYFIRPLIGNQKAAKLWSSICFKIMTQYTCGFLPRILVIFPALWVFLPSLRPFSPQTRIYMSTTRAHIYALQTSLCIWGYRKSSCKRHRIIPSAKNPFM